MAYKRAIKAIGLARAIETVGRDKVLDELLATTPAEQIQEMLRRRQQGS